MKLPRVRAAARHGPNRLFADPGPAPERLDRRSIAWHEAASCVKRCNDVTVFSFQVVEAPFQTLLEGHVRTTGGTDFDCVAQSLIDRGYTKAVIRTDGWASLKPD